MKRVIVILFIILNALSAAGSSLYKNNAVFNLSELLHASRFEYEHGIEINFPFQAWDQESIKQNCSRLESIPSLEIYNVYEEAVENHLNAYGDEEFDFESSLVELREELNEMPFIYKCLDNNSELSYFGPDLSDLVVIKKY